MTKQNRLLTPEEMDNCVPTEAELLEYLSEPDDTIAKGLTLKEKRLVAKAILYGRKIAQAQREMTLKEVGEWLEANKGEGYCNEPCCYITKRKLEALKRGKLGG